MEVVRKIQADLANSQQRFESLWVSKDRMQANHKEEVKNPKKKLREEGSKSQEVSKQWESLEKQVQSQQVQIDELDVQLREKDALQFVTETWLKGRDVQLAQLIEELTQLKARFRVWH